MKTDKSSAPSRNGAAQTGRIARQIRSAAVWLAPVFLLGAAQLSAADAPQTNPEAPAKSVSEQAPAQAAKPAANAAPAAAAQLDPVVVVASREPESLSVLSPSVAYIGQEEMLQAGNHTLVDALREQPGVYLSTSGAPGSQVSIFTRGTNSNMTTVLLDGRRLNPGFSGGYDLSSYGTDNLSSVQMLRGAGSTLYGSSAIGGAIDMRTVDPLALRKPTASLGLEGGSFGYRRGSLEVAGSASGLGLVKTDDSGRAVDTDFGFSLGGSWTETDNKRLHNQYYVGQLLPRFDYQLNKNVRFNLVSRFNEYRLQLPGSVAAPSRTDWQSGRDWLISPGVEIRPTDNVKVQAFYSYANNLIESFSYGSLSHYEQDKHEATILASWQVTDAIEIAGGYTFESTGYDQHAWSNYRSTWDSNSPWLHLQLRPVTGLKVVLGARYNSFNNFKDAWTGEALVSYDIRPTDTTLHAKLASAYRTPSANDIAGGTVGGKELKPEQSVSWELGLRQNIKLLQGASLSVVYFDNSLRDLIDFQSNPTTWNYEAFNISKATTRGWEFGAALKPASQVRLYANASLLQAESKSAVPSSSIRAGDRLRRRPDWTATLGAEITPTDALTLGISFTHFHGREDYDWGAGRTVDLKNYTYGRLYANWRPVEHVEVFGRIENLLDARYEPAALGYPGLPLGAYVGIRLSY